jgi:hypothetical protein
MSFYQQGVGIKNLYKKQFIFASVSLFLVFTNSAYGFSSSSGGGGKSKPPQDSPVNSDYDAFSNRQHMTNTLRLRSDGQFNKSFGNMIKNIMIFQVAGWAGNLKNENSNEFLTRLDPPKFGGDRAYLSKNEITFDRQAEMLSEMSPFLAAGVLIMDDGDSSSSGYGACWNGTWVRETEGANKQRICDGGTYSLPRDLYLHFKKSARKKGLMVAPNFSIMNWEKPNRYDGARFLPKLKSLLDWVRPTLDEGNLKTNDGKWVVILDSLPSTANINDTQRRQIHQYMKDQTDIFWIDNAVSVMSGNILNANNIFGSTWGSLRTQERVNDIWNGDFLNWYSRYNENPRSYENSFNPSVQRPEDDRLEMLNVLRYDQDKYPIVISQFNEFAEQLYFEPSKRAGMSHYNRMKNYMTQQGPRKTAFIESSFSDFTMPSESYTPSSEFIRKDFSYTVLKKNMGTVDSDQGGKEGLLASPGKTSRTGIFTYGPYIPLDEGEYTVVYELSSKGGSSDDKVAILEVTSEGGKVKHVSKDLFKKDVSGDGFDLYEVNFKLDQAQRGFEFRLIWTGKSNLKIRKVFVQKEDLI